MRHNTSQMLFVYWDQLRAGRKAPQRAEIDPACIGQILPHTFMLECHQPERYRFRIAGTKLCEYCAMELRGYDFLDLWRPYDRKTVKHKLQAITALRDITPINAISRTRRGESARSELLILPLCGPDGIIYRLLGVWSLPVQEAWSGHSPFIEHSLIRPDDVNEPAKDDCSRTKAVTVGLPDHRQGGQGRTFIAQRRRFRVYNGGRA